MYQDNNIRYIYAKENIKIAENIKKRKINIDKVMKSYELGTSKENIKIQYRLNDEELNYILRTYMTSQIRDRRLQSEKIMDSFHCNFIGNDKEKTNNKLTIQEAIKLVEGKEERED